MQRRKCLRQEAKTIFVRIPTRVFQSCVNTWDVQFRISPSEQAIFLLSVPIRTRSEFMYSSIGIVASILLWCIFRNGELGFWHITGDLMSNVDCVIDVLS